MNNSPSNNVVEHPDFKLFVNTKNNFTFLPIYNKEIYDFYKKMQSVDWKVEEVSLDKDIADWENKLTENERIFVLNILSFFAASDGIVAKNIDDNFVLEIDIKEVRAVYTFQSNIEIVHSEMYSRLIEAYIKDKSKQEKAINAIINMPCIIKKSNWALKWFDAKKHNIATRLLAFTAVEGIHFSGAFCAIFWLKKRNLMPGLTFSNEFISRDEGLHTEFGVLMYSLAKNKPSNATVIEIITEAVEIEKEFITDSIPCALLGMNNILMKQYIEYVADRLTVQLGYKKIYNTKNPFIFMENISINNKTNFFENRVSEYNTPGVGNKKEDHIFTTDADF